MLIFLTHFFSSGKKMITLCPTLPYMHSRVVILLVPLLERGNSALSNWFENIHATKTLSRSSEKNSRCQTHCSADWSHLRAHCMACLPWRVSTPVDTNCSVPRMGRLNHHNCLLAKTLWKSTVSVRTISLQFGVVAFNHVLTFHLLMETDGGWSFQTFLIVMPLKLTGWKDYLQH